MKAIYSILIILVAIFTFASCDMDKATLKADVELNNEDCPIDLDNGMVVDKITLDEDDSFVVYHISVDENQMDVKSISGFAQIAKPIYAHMFYENEDSHDFLKDVIDANAGIKMIITGKNDKKQESFIFTTEELKKILKGDFDEFAENKSTFSGLIKTMNDQCPLDMGEGMAITKISDDGTSIVYEVDMTDSEISIADMRANESVFKDGVKEGFSDPEMKEMIELCVKYDKGIIYRCLNNKSGQSFDIRFSKEELKNML